MKKLIFAFILLLTLSTGVMAGGYVETGKKEVIKVVRSVEIDYEENDLVIIKNYQGKYGDTLNLIMMDLKTGYESYSVAIFGSVRDLELVSGKWESEGYTKKIGDLVSNTLIKFENAPPLSEKDIYVAISFKDNNGTKHTMPLTNDKEGYLVVEDTGKLTAEPGHVLQATYPAEECTFYVEVDKSDEFVSGLHKHYLYMEVGGEKRLLTESVDMGSNWLESVGHILNPTLSNDGTKVYYETSNRFNRSNGVAANNHQTRVIDLKTMSDEYFHEGGIVKLLTPEYAPFTDGLILEKYTRNDDWEVVTNNYLVSPEKKTLVNLGAELEDDLVEQIIRKMEEEYGVEIDPDNLQPKRIDETIHGQHIDYSRYLLVVIEDYADRGKNKLQNTIEFKNPLYDKAPYNYYNFAVFGTITNVKLKTKRDMSSEYRIYDIADEISDSLVKVTSRFPTDFSLDRISFYAEDGQHVEIIIEDVSDQKDIVKLEKPF